jgi:hypothetical protein
MDTASVASPASSGKDESLEFRRRDYPGLSLTAGDLSAVGQRQYMRLILAELIAGFIAAFFSDGSSLFPDGYQGWLAGITVVFLGLAIGAQAWRRYRKFDQSWFTGRAVRESTKTVTWQYMMRVPPYDDDSRAGAELLAVVDEIREAASRTGTTFPEAANDGPVITEQMERVRGANWQDRCGLYLRARVRDQITWYGEKARENADLARRFSILTVVGQGAAICLAIVRVVYPSWNLVGVLTTLVASMIAWTQAKRFDELAASYRLARDELEQITARLEGCSSEVELLSVVIDAEGAISREHTMWVARSGSAIVWDIERRRWSSPSSRTAATPTGPQASAEGSASAEGAPPTG